MLSALNSEMLLQSISQQDSDKNEDLEFLYLKRLKASIENGVRAVGSSRDRLSELYNENQVK